MKSSMFTSMELETLNAIYDTADYDEISKKNSLLHIYIYKAGNYSIPFSF